MAAVGLFALLNHSILKTLMNKIEKAKLKDVMTKQHIKFLKTSFHFLLFFFTLKIFLLEKEEEKTVQRCKRRTKDSCVFLSFNSS